MTDTCMDWPQPPAYDIVEPGNEPAWTPESAQRYWTERFDGLLATFGDSTYGPVIYWLKAVTNDLDNFKSGQGQIRPHVPLGRFDLYYRFCEQFRGYRRELREVLGIMPDEIEPSLR